MNNIKINMKKVFLSLLIALPAPAFCGDSEGPIKDYLIIIQGKLFFHAGVAAARPVCSTIDEWAIDLVGPNAAIGRVMLATIMSAHASGKKVRIHGTGVCDVWGDRETVGAVYSLEK